MTSIYYILFRLGNGNHAIKSKYLRRCFFSGFLPARLEGHYGRVITRYRPKILGFAWLNLDPLKAHVSSFDDISSANIGKYWGVVHFLLRYLVSCCGLGCLCERKRRIGFKALGDRFLVSRVYLQFIAITVLIKV